MAHIKPIMEIDEKIEKLATKALPANVKNIGTTKD